MAVLDINTKSIICNKKLYCAYCGKEVKAEVEWRDYEDTYWYHCDCETALKEIEKQKEVRKKEYELNSLKWQLRDIQNSAKYQLVKRETVEKVK